MNGTTAQKIIIALLFLLMSVSLLKAQVGIGTATPHSSAQLKLGAPPKIV